MPSQCPHLGSSPAPGSLLAAEQGEVTTPRSPAARQYPQHVHWDGIPSSQDLPPNPDKGAERGWGGNREEEEDDGQESASQGRKEMEAGAAHSIPAEGEGGEKSYCGSQGCVHPAAPRRHLTSNASGGRRFPCEHASGNLRGMRSPPFTPPSPFPSRSPGSSSSAAFR